MMTFCQAYTSQYIALLMMALQLSEDRISFTERHSQIILGLHALPGQIKKVLEQDKALQQLANTLLANAKSLLIMGRGFQCVSRRYLRRLCQRQLFV
jgi:glucosamine--fructose-6-phosphate aminotransferase (isomerizing)